MAGRNVGARSRSRSSSSFIKIIGPLSLLAIASIVYNIHYLIDLQSYTKTIISYYDQSFDAPAIERRVNKWDDFGMWGYKWEELKKEHRPDHGTFYFGPHSQQIKIPTDAKLDPRDDW
jgi:hypothetical protein